MQGAIFRSVADGVSAIFCRSEVVALALVMLAAMVLGGSSKHYPILDVIVQTVSLFAICMTVWIGRSLAERRPPAHLLALAMMLVLFLFFQLVPLPPAIWHALPGRAFARDIMDVAGISSSWHPFTMTPEATRFAILGALPPLAGFIIMLVVPDATVRPLFALMLAIIFTSATIGMFQVASAGALFPFYGNFYAGSSNGLLANRNHHSDMQTIGMLLLILWRRRSRRRSGLPSVVLIAAALFLFAGVLATQSRAGVLFSVATLLAAAIYLAFAVRGERKANGKPEFRLWPAGSNEKTGSRRRRRHTNTKRLNGKHLRHPLILSAAGCGMLVFVIYFSLDRLQSLAVRYSSVSDDLRIGFWRTTADWGWRYFPFGSGLGSFDDVYRAYENLNFVTPAAVNAAHNDYLELYATLGVAGILFPILMITLITRSAMKAWRIQQGEARDRVFVASASLTLLLLHSIFDYPLQTSSLAFGFAVFLAQLVRLGYMPEQSREGRDKL